MIMIRAAFALLAIAASAAIDVRPAAAVTYRPWCVQYSGGSGNNGLTCAFSSFEQCMMTGGPGTGGSCVQNPWYLWYGFITLVGNDRAIEGAEIPVHRSDRGYHHQPEQCPARRIKKDLPIVARGWTITNQMPPGRAQFSH